MVDWNFILESYNKIKGTKYLTDEDMLRAVHRKVKSLRNMETVLGVSWATIATKMDYYGIKRRKQPREGEYPAKIAAIPAEELLTMTSREVAARVGSSHDWVMRNLARQGRPYKRRFPFYERGMA
uniref:Uncharacterized protein n=1 Tax=viral metagenome TaxID=1070528 RepID=A0A6M3LIN0_9ZZZZ